MTAEPDNVRPDNVRPEPALPGYTLGPLERAWVKHVFACGKHTVRGYAVTAAIHGLLDSMLSEILEPTRTATFEQPTEHDEKNQDA